MKKLIISTIFLLVFEAATVINMHIAEAEKNDFLLFFFIALSFVAVGVYWAINQPSTKEYYAKK